MPLRIAGVPEHFNLPWQLAIEHNDFVDAGLDIQWQFNSAGTGSMVKALANDEIDMAIVLTEGIVAAIANGLEAKIVKPFITTPLIWGIHTGAASTVTNAIDCHDCRIAISRFGSGSHLMAMIDANANNRKLTESSFTVVTDINGALKSLTSNETQLFYWEKFTTKPYVDSGQLRRIGEFLTPWPCFIIAASNKALREKQEDIIATLNVINRVAARYIASPDAIQLLIERFHMKPEDATAWFYNTDWSYDYTLSAKMLINAMHALKTVGAIKENVEMSQLTAPFLNLI